jgi:hypothetical protein
MFNLLSFPFPQQSWSETKNHTENFLRFLKSSLFSKRRLFEKCLIEKEIEIVSKLFLCNFSQDLRICSNVKMIVRTI